MQNKKHSTILKSNRDYKTLFAIEATLLRQAGSISKLKAELPTLLKNALAEVIDNERTGRRTLSDLEKTEKTYIGTKVEILVRNYFRLPKGNLDLKINGNDVDIKNTVGSNWMIPPEALNKACILVALNDQFCWFGVFMASPENLTSGANRDQKRSVSAAGFLNIHWILFGEKYPAVAELPNCPSCGRKSA